MDIDSLFLVLKYRTNRFAVVLERPYDDFNQQAVIRTADCFGIQNVYIIVCFNRGPHNS